MANINDLGSVHLINLQIMLEVLVAEHMLAWYLEHRERYALRIVLSALGCLFLAWIFPVPEFANRFIISWGTLMYVSLFTFATAGLALCYQEDFLGIFCCAIMGYTVQHLASALIDLSDKLFTMVGKTVPYLARWIVISIVVYSISYRLLSKRIRKNGHIHIDNRMLPALSAAVLLVDIISGLVLLKLSVNGEILSYAALVHFHEMLACLFILGVQNSLLSNHRLETELAVLSQMLQEEKHQYEQSRTNVEIINQKCHDLKYQIRSLDTGSGVVDSAVLKKIEQAVDIYDTAMQTGCAALDVILSEKKLLCESKGIMLTCIADGSGLVDMPAADIYALFGNVLDNAVEAVTALQDDEAKSISLSVRRRGKVTIIHEENRFGGEITLRDGLPETIKEDKMYHGFGVRSIRMIAENHNGYVTIDTADGIFSMTVMLSPGTQG